jgi:hypothetical protein
LATAEATEPIVDLGVDSERSAAARRMAEVDAAPMLVRVVTAGEAGCAEGICARDVAFADRKTMSVETLGLSDCFSQRVHFAVEAVVSIAALEVLATMKLTDLGDATEREVPTEWNAECSASLRDDVGARVSTDDLPLEDMAERLGWGERKLHRLPLLEEAGLTVRVGVGVEGRKLELKAKPTMIDMSANLLEKTLDDIQT